LQGTKCRLFRCFGFIGLLFLICFCAYLFPQNINSKKEVSLKSSSTFGVKVNAIVINASVTDKSGNPVTDLTVRDFKLYEDGEPKNIQTFALESIDPPELGTLPVANVLPQHEGQDPNPNAAQLPRLISIVIDDLTMESPSTFSNKDFVRPGSILEFPRMKDAIKKFVTTDLSPTDQVAILSGSRKVQFPFTDNKQRLLEELDVVPAKLNTLWALRPDDEFDTNDYTAWMYANDLVWEGFNKFVTVNKKVIDTERKRALMIRQNDDVSSRTRNLLYTIRLNLRTLSHFEGPKMIMLFSDGFITEIGRRTGAAEAHELQELVDLALHSGIIINTVSTRGIFVESLTSSAAVDEGGGISFLASDETDRMMQEKPLAQIASETGGKFFPSSNDMYIGLRTIAHRRHSYYVLTYVMPAHKPDGAYHHIKLEVTRPGLEVSYRKGYYDPTEELTFENNNKEDLMAALHGPGNMNEIPITLSYNYSQEADSSYAVSFVSKVNIHGLQFPEEDNRRRNQISLVLAAFDENDHFISGLEKSIDFQLLENSYAELLQRGLTSGVELKLPIGRYKIKAVVRENNQGKMGSITKSIEIP